MLNDDELPPLPDYLSPGHRNRRATPDELKPCPFCGSTDISNVSSRIAGPAYDWHAGDTIFVVNCRGCGASVPSRYRNDLVVEAWNRRTQSGKVAATNDAKEER